jgi:hypothetical protein
MPDLALVALLDVFGTSRSAGSRKLAPERAATVIPRVAASCFALSFAATGNEPVLLRVVTIMTLDFQIRSIIVAGVGAKEKQAHYKRVW